MSLLRDHLRHARREYAAVRYPDDLAAQVMHRPRRWLWRIGVAASGLSGLAAAVVLLAILNRAGQSAGPASGVALSQVVPVPPPLPAGVSLVPPYMSLAVPPMPTPQLARPGLAQRDNDRDTHREEL